MNPILAQMNNQVALIEEGHATWLAACLDQVHAAQDKLTASTGEADFWSEGMSWARPYTVKNGVLHIPVKGVLLNDFPYALGNWATGYEYIWQAVKRGTEDSNVKGIALVINSGGGMVSGNWDLIDRIYGARGSKPIRAFAAEHAYSAAYNIAAAADHITVARTGGVGSIGVIITHFEISKALEQSGYKVTLIRSKPEKAEGGPYEALSEGARMRMQERVDESDSQFVAMVARNRGMSAEAVQKLGAYTFMAQQAIDNGLADEIGALDDAITAFAASLDEGDDTMADLNKAGITEEAHAAAVSAAKAEGVTEGTGGERARITTILGSDAAKTRPAAALMMVDLGVSADNAAVQLAKLPEEKPAASAEQPAAGAGVPAAIFAAAMNGTENPGIQAEDSADDKSGDASKNKGADLRALAQRAGIKGYAKSDA